VARAVGRQAEEAVEVVVKMATEMVEVARVVVAVIVAVAGVRESQGVLAMAAATGVSWVVERAAPAAAVTPT
jgi:hypothetical protein